MKRSTYKKNKTGAGGSKGTDYQIKLLEFFLLQGYHNKNFFELSTEYPNVGSFDDVVFESAETTILLQAKHRVCGEITALRAVLAAGAQVSTPDVHGGYPLHYAAQMCGGDRDSNLGLQVLQTLLSHTYIQVSVIDVDKREPLLWAASAGSARAVLALVRAGANVESADKDGLTALHCAASRGHTDCMDTLLTLCGASVDIIDTNGCTALHYSVTLGHADATALLLAHGADPNRQDRKGRSPTHCGCAKGQFETVKLIGTHGANLWLRNARGDFPLHDAAASGRRELVKWLLEMRPSQVNARNNDGRCPLHMTALNDNADMCKILLDAGAHINPVLRTSKNVFMTPLDCALQKGYRSTAKFLQLNGGVPATRLSDPSNQQINSALNLHIRDDVAFYGDTSSESERENVAVTKSAKQTLRKKTSFKQDKKKSSMSGSEKEQKEQIGIKLSKQKSIDKSTAKSDGRRKTSSRIDYSNEIIINGKTEVNVSQTNQIIMDKESVQTQTSAKFNENRPKSAKYGRSREQSAQSSLKHETMISISSQASVSKKDHSTNTSEEASKSINENNTNKSKVDLLENNDTKLSANKVLPDQSSLRSYTSEDADEPKTDILVEASVHPLPKSLAGTEENKEDLVVDKTIVQKGDENNEIEKNLMETHEKFEKIENELKADNIKSEISTKSNNVKDEEDKKLVIETNEENKILSNKIEENTQLQNREFKTETNVENKVGAVQNKEEKNMDNESNMEQSQLESITKTEIEVQHTDPEQHTISDTQITEGNRKKTSTEIKNDIDIDSKDTTNVKLNQEISLTKQKEKETKTEEKTDQKIGSQAKQSDDQSSKEKEAPRKSENTSETQMNDKKETKQELTTENFSYSSSFSDEDEFLERTHKSFRVLNDKDVDEADKTRRKKRHKRDEVADEIRSRSLETKTKDKIKRSKIPTPLFKSTLSKSDRHLNQSYKETNLDARIPSLPNIRGERNLKDPPRCDSNMSAPLLTSILSDQERDSVSDLEEESRSKSKRFIKKRSKNRDSRSAGSDYESSNLIDSGFEPSPRSTRVPKWKNVSDRGVNMTSVTQSIQTNIRRYHLERKIFQQLLELKRHQIRAGQHNEAVLVKRAIDAYHKSCASTVGVGRYVAEDFTFKSFEKFLYEALRKLQKNGDDYIRGLPETPINPMFCTKSTNRCMHAAHAYTGVPCAAYLPKMDHHTIPKIGFNNSVECIPGTGGFLPTIIPKKAVTLELGHGNDKQVISLPTDKLDQNKRYYVTFTVKGHEANSDVDRFNNNDSAHRHSKSE